jgi:sensor histidine kinase YesM
MQKQNGMLSFRCYNSKEEESVRSRNHKGIGIDNTKRRLALHYGRKHELKITNERSFYEVDLKIQVQ